LIPSNDVNYENTDGIKTVYNGPSSAVVALTPFLGSGSGLQGYSLSTALANQGSVSLPTVGTIPTE
jgi:hypothetical protein